MKKMVLDSNAYGTVITATLTFTDFDPIGGSALLQLINQPPRNMQLDGTGTIATYTTTPYDFNTGKFLALVLVTKSGVRVPSERFQLEVL